MLGFERVLPKKSHEHPISPFNQVGFGKQRFYFACPAESWVIWGGFGVFSPVLTVGTSLRAAPARPHLVLLFQEHLQDLLGEEEEVEAPENHGGFGDVVIFLGVEAKSLRVRGE